MHIHMEKEGEEEEDLIVLIKGIKVEEIESSKWGGGGNICMNGRALA